MMMLVLSVAPPMVTKGHLFTFWLPEWNVGSEEIMKKCQRGFGNYKTALDDANNLLAECYGHIGMLENKLESAIVVESAVKIALLDAKALAMRNTIEARIPECGDFGGIAQNLAFVCDQLGIKDS